VRFSEIKSLLSIGAGISMAVAASVGIAVIETLIVARLGADALAGVTLALALYSLVFVGCLGVVVAITPILSRAVGGGDTHAIRCLAHQVGFVAGAMSLIGFVVFALSPVLLAPMASHPGELDVALRYLAGAAPGLTAWLGYIALRSVLMTLGSVRIATITMLASVPVHALMAYALVHGTPWTPELGVLGAGIAHCAVSWVTVAVILLAMRRSGQPLVSAIMRGPVTFSGPEFRAIFRLGIPMSARILLREGMLPASVMLVAPAGGAMIAAHAVAMRVVGLAGIASFGIGSAAIVRVGEALGAGDRRRARDVSRLAIFLSLASGIAASIVIVACAPQIAALFLPAADAVTPVATRLLMVACVFLLIDCVQGTLGAGLVALQDARVPLAIYAVCIWLVGFPLAHVCASVFPVAAEGVWFGLSIGSAIATALMVVRWRAKFRTAEA
jgi:MATE family multidrug resistance protein